jgi:hypothetical protein
MGMSWLAEHRPGTGDGADVEEIGVPRFAPWVSLNII